MENFLIENWWIIPVVIIWTIPWKAVALWKTAKRNQKAWFVVFIILNTLAILEILYLFVFSKKEKQPENNLQKNADSERRAKKFEQEMKELRTERKILVN